ncbi:MAG: DUF3300 domain-containing protein [Candidatus Korobacteraceae bacterium]|jgi:hypothetical protein
MGVVKRATGGLSLGLSILLVFTIGPGAATSMAYQGAEPSPAGSTAPNYPGQGVPATADELQSVVAPIALYPDALVAQILSAATFPDQVAIANYWVQQNKTLTGNALATAVDKQTWDPSVKALTQFPSVLNNMAQNLAWTSQLGEDYHNQQAELMTAIQTLRAKAKAAGNLKSGSQITVVQQSPQTIVIQPTNPQIVYVPQYNPTVIYGTPYVVPAYSTGDMVAASVLSFGAGMAVGAMMSGGCCGWGYSSWNCNWYGGAAVYHGGAYYGNSAWHGGYYGTTASAYGAYGSAHASSGYNPSTGTYARGASTSTAYGTQKVGQAYNPYTGAYGATHQGSNAYSNWGSSTASKNGQTVDTQHYSDANGTVGTAESSNGNKYATANGNAYKNTGSGWQKAGSSDAAHGWGGSGGSESHSGGSSAFSGWGSHSGDSGWGSRSASARGWGSRGGGGGWGGRGGGGGWGGRR